MPPKKQNFNYQIPKDDQVKAPELAIEERTDEPTPATDNYFEIDALSSSPLKLYSKSRLEYNDRYNLGLIDDETTKAMRLGTMVHCHLLEPEQFWNRYAKPIVLPEGKIILDTVDQTGTDLVTYLIVHLGTG